MVGEDVGAVDADRDPLHVGGGDARRHRVESRIDGAMLEAAAGIGLHRRAESAEIATQAARHGFGIDRLAVREGAEEASIALEDGGGAGEALAREARGENAAHAPRGRDAGA